MKWLASVARSRRVTVAQGKTRSMPQRKRPAMEHVAIDLGVRESQICVRSADGTIVDERRYATKDLKRYLEGRPPSRVVVETCSESFAVADAAEALGHQVRVVPGTLVRSLGVGARRTKTDRRDAQILSEVSCRIELPSVHVSSALSRRRKTICGMRTALVTARTSLINTVHGWLRGQGQGVLRSGIPETFGKRVKKHFSEELPSYVERQLEAIDHLSEQIVEADQDLEKMANKDDECRRLMTVPGVGPVTALLMVAAIDDVGRFDGAHKVQAYLGLTPGEHSSSERRHRTSITKAGSPSVRRALVQAAWAARRAKGAHPMVLWSLEVEKRRGRRVAVIALARKIAGILYALLRDGSTYQAFRPASMATTP
jgi:transposase